MKIRTDARAVARLFLSMLTIGAFTFGGGYAMLSLMQNEFVAKRKWIGEKEFLDVAAIAESTPGPIAINAATYVGFKVGGFVGAAAATVAMCLPSFAVIYVVSMFLDRFMELRLVACAFRGIQVCVVYLVLTAGLRMRRSLPRDVFHRIILFGTVACMLAVNLFAVNFSSIYLILVCGAIGIAADALRRMRAKDKEAR